LEKQFGGICPILHLPALWLFSLWILSRNILVFINLVYLFMVSVKWWFMTFEEC
jgi:hypothetical protein